VFIDLSKELIPSFDESTFTLVSNELKLVGRPAVFDVSNKVFKDQFSSCFIENFGDDFVIFDHISLPEIEKNQVIEFDFDLQLEQELFPVSWLHGFTFKLKENGVGFSILLEVSFVLIIDVVGSQSIWEFIHLLKNLVKGILDFLVHVSGERCLINLVDGLPNLMDFAPNTFQQSLVFNKTLKSLGVSKLHIQKLLGFADSNPFRVACLDLFPNDVELV